MLYPVIIENKKIHQDNVNPHQHRFQRKLTSAGQYGLVSKNNVRIVSHESARTNLDHHLISYPLNPAMDLYYCPAVLKSIPYRMLSLNISLHENLLSEDNYHKQRYSEYLPIYLARVHTEHISEKTQTRPLKLTSFLGSYMLSSPFIGSIRNYFYLILPFAKLLRFYG